ncbi:MAG: PP2C family protein-serine/threonine phosphatase [Bryobacteraceae bacterium]
MEASVVDLPQLRKPGQYRQLKSGLVLGIGAVVALVLCIQCVRTYLYTGAVLVPRQAEHEAERQVGALTAGVRSAGITDPHALGALLDHVLESSSDRVLWMRVLDPESRELAHAGKPEGTAKIPSQWWTRVEAHESLGAVTETAQGKALVAMLPFRMPRPAHAPEARRVSPISGGPSGDHRPPVYVVELATSLQAVAGSFEGLRQNLIVGVIASVALLAALALIALRAPHYLRGKYLENELQLAKRVQSDLQPKPDSLSPIVDFAACSVAADHVGGDFYDIFEAGSGKIAVVLGDVSGKGVPAALLVSVLQGAIRSSTASDHEYACERINGMLCERSAGERFATLFWGVFDPATSIMRYVNGGHIAPMLIRHHRNKIERLDEGGPVLGLLPNARYSAGTIAMESSDTLVLYSDGLSEATNQSEEEFGEDRLIPSIAAAHGGTLHELCDRIMSQVTSFGTAGPPPDDRTLLAVRFPQAGAALRLHTSEEMGVQVTA